MKTNTNFDYPGIECLDDVAVDPERSDFFGYPYAIAIDKEVLKWGDVEGDTAGVVTFCYGDDFKEYTVKDAILLNIISQWVAKNAMALATCGNIQHKCIIYRDEANDGWVIDYP